MGSVRKNATTAQEPTAPASNSSGDARGRMLRGLYLAALFSLLLLGGITFIVATFHKVAYPFGWDDDEGAVWWEVAHVTNLRSLYHPIHQYPYFVVPYPPVFHAVAWVAAKVTGNFLVGGRLVCVLAALGIGVLAALLVYGASPRRIPPLIRASAGLLAMLLWFRLDSLNQYIPEMGVDLLAVFLTFLGAFVFIRSVHKPAAQYAAFACLVLALFTKQTMIAAPFACLATSAVINARRALKQLAFCFGLGALTLAVLAWATSGEILRHLFFYNARQPFSLVQWLLGIQANVLSMVPVVVLAGLAFLPFVQRAVFSRWQEFWQWLRAGLQTSPYRRALFVLGLEVSMALATSLSYGKVGSGVHYFLEWNLVCCPMVGLLFARTLARWKPNARYSLGGAAIFLLLLVVALTGFPESLRRINGILLLSPSERHLQAVEYANNSAALKVIEDTPGPVWCENMVLVMKAHKGIPIEPGIQCFLARAGIWDQSPFIHMITSQQFGVIIMRTLDNGFWTDAMVEAIEKNYVPTQQIGDESIEDCHYTVYRPRLH